MQDVKCHISLTHDPLNVVDIIDRVRSPKAGAIVLFAGTTRDNFGGKPVRELEYTSYEPRALQTMTQIGNDMCSKHSLTGFALIHRLGVVPIGEDSILIAVSSPHRQAAWKAGEEALEECKAKVEVWKKEEFIGEQGGVWRANRDGTAGVRVERSVDMAKEGDRVIIGGSSQIPDEVRRPKAPFERGHGPVAHPT